MSCLTKYRDRCRKLHSTPGTTERSYYRAIGELLEGHTGPLINAPSELSVSASPGSDRKSPDLGLYEAKTPLIYVEVKPSATVDDLLADRDGQVYKYAEALGGWALATNLNDYVLVRIEGNALVEQKSVRLFSSDIHDKKTPQPTKGASGQLEDILLLGCAQRQVARGAPEVARLLAVHAKELANVLPGESLGVIRGAFKVWLGAELDEKFLVSTTVQAVVYGMFAKWLESDTPEQFKWEEVRERLGVGAIGEIVYSALGPGVVGRPGIESLLEGIAGVLRRTDQKGLAEQFDGQAIEYFYEPFLAEYDPALRDSLGVWYTPPEIAAYQVARADRHLREDLHVKGGLANRSVIVLDPAVGTGTYLAAAYDYLYEARLEDGYSREESTDILSDAAKSRIVGLDILPAALLVADLNLRRRLRRRGVPLAPDERPAVFLANSLSGWFEKDDPDTLPWLAIREEVEAANRYKHDERVLVVLGNPPYHGYSSAETGDERRLVAPWTAPLASEWGIRKHRLNDPYVRFWAAAARRIATFTKNGHRLFHHQPQMVGRTQLSRHAGRPALRLRPTDRGRPGRRRPRRQHNRRRIGVYHNHRYGHPGRHGDRNGSEITGLHWRRRRPLRPPRRHHPADAFPHRLGHRQTNRVEPIPRRCNGRRPVCVADQQRCPMEDRQNLDLGRLGSGQRVLRLLQLRSTACPRPGGDRQRPTSSDRTDGRVLRP